MGNIAMDDSNGPATERLAAFEESVKSLAVIEGDRVTAFLRNPALTYQSAAVSETFKVTDLLSNVEYVVSRFGSRIQMLVPVKDRLIVAEVDSQADVSEVAEMLTNRLVA